MALVAIPSWWAYHHISAWVGHEVTREDLVNVCRLSMQALLLPMSIALYLFLRRMTRRRFIAQSVYWSMTLGTMGYAYSMIFASHQLATMSLFTLFAILAWRPQNVLAAYPRASTHTLYGLGGLLGGLAVSAEYSAVLPACLIGLYGLFRGTAPVERVESGSVTAKLVAFARSRRHLWSVLGGVMPIAAYTMWYHKLTFGGVLETPYKHMLNPVFRRRMEESAGGFQSPSLETTFEIFFGATNGLFILSPFLMLALTGVAVWAWRRRHTLEVMLGVTIIGVMTLYLSSVAFDWIGGWSVGPRYLSNVLPAMGLLVAYGLNELDDKNRLVTRALIGGLGAASILLSAPISMVFPHIPGWVEHPALDASIALAREAIVPLNRLGLPDTLFATLAYGFLLGLCVWMLAGATRRHHTRQIAASVAVLAIALWAIVSIEKPDPRRGRFVDYVHKFEAPKHAESHGPSHHSTGAASSPPGI